ncbi:hypothetical protein SK629_0238 [Streptococcus mitis]|uniref:Uncharacterized protein n=1 Tax=Streptococcus mitis TaxID=28037 RepID=A0A081Q6D2_STRMT|nr:hypothetical protein SK629_0238 [Streptococcus mitis]
MSYQNNKASLVTTVRTSKSQYEFIFPSVKIKEEKKEKVVTDSSEKAEKKKSEEKLEKKEKS